MACVHANIQKVFSFSCCLALFYHFCLSHLLLYDCNKWHNYVMAHVKRLRIIFYSLREVKSNNCLHGGRVRFQTLNGSDMIYKILITCSALCQRDKTPNWATCFHYFFLPYSPSLSEYWVQPETATWVRSLDPEISSSGPLQSWLIEDLPSLVIRST